MKSHKKFNEKRNIHNGRMHYNLKIQTAGQSSWIVRSMTSCSPRRGIKSTTFPQSNEQIAGTNLIDEIGFGLGLIISLFQGRKIERGLASVHWYSKQTHTCSHAELGWAKTRDKDLASSFVLRKCKRPGMKLSLVSRRWAKRELRSKTTWVLNEEARFEKKQSIRWLVT